MAKKQAKVVGTAPDPKPQTSHRAKDPEIVARSQKFFGVLAKFGKSVAIILVVFAVGYFGLGYFGYKNYEYKGAQKPKGVAQVAMKPQEALPEEIVTPPFTVYGKGKWSVVNVPAGYTFTYTCSGWGLVKVYGNNIDPKGCGPRNSTPEDWFGDNLNTEEGPDRKQRLRVAFTSTSKGPITAQVTMTKNH